MERTEMGLVLQMHLALSNFVLAEPRECSSLKLC